MKRTSSGAAADVHHPALAFHREVLIVQQWASIRRQFLTALENVAKTGAVEWKEPRKLWRHAQEALGKWILSQVARVQTAPKPALSTATAASSSSAASLEEQTSILFFPTADQFRAVQGADIITYDEQLIRDLTLKSNGTNCTAAVDAIVAVVKAFKLGRRCAAAAEAIREQMEGVTPQLAAAPRIRRLEPEDPSRTLQQRRIHGPIAEVSVVWPRSWSRDQCRDCPPVSVPWAAMTKLKSSYEMFGLAVEEKLHGVAECRGDGTTHFELRAATVILRYEGGLATGSLQLCADTGLKQHLHATGYHVMDLCASPINAYMGTPLLGSFRKAAVKGKAEPADHAGTTDGTPNHFCSAFTDTDIYFGSMGSAVCVDPIAMYHSPTINPGKKPLLLTLDVPYDEDLCELFFLKLIRDMQRAAQEGSGCRIDYVLVLPLWWAIPLQIRKRLFCDEPADASNLKEAATDATVAEIVNARAAVLEEGYKVPYTWPVALSAAAGDATNAQALSSSKCNKQQKRDGKSDSPWVCFDGIFIGNRYGYFCTATNKHLYGVTATEVIGLEQPRALSDGGHTLQVALNDFYGPG